jgi:endogenous inhibitor of DNA gyrase (YacG/DUF329 family)
MRRADRLAAVRALHEQGLFAREIAERLGISRSYAASLLSDPTGDKDRKRKESYRRPCPLCGELMCGGDGNGRKAPVVCHRCQGVAYQKWTAEAILELFEGWVADHGGRAPAIWEWHPVYIRDHVEDGRMNSEDALRRYADAVADQTQYPALDTIYKHFGSWEGLCQAAGVVSRWRYRPKVFV